MAEIKDESEQMTKKKPKRNKKKRMEPRVDGLGNGGTNHVEPEKGISEKVQVIVKEGTSKINGGTIEVEPEEGKVEKVKGGTGKINGKHRGDHRKNRLVWDEKTSSLHFIKWSRVCQSIVGKKKGQIALSRRALDGWN